MAHARSVYGFQDHLHRDRSLRAAGLEEEIVSIITLGELPGLLGGDSALWRRSSTILGRATVCDELAHIYLYEGGGIAANSGSSVRLLQGQHGRFTAAQVRENINRRDDSHLPWTRLVAVENTVNRGGGCCWDLSEIERIRAVCKE